MKNLEKLKEIKTILLTAYSCGLVSYYECVRRYCKTLDELFPDTQGRRADLAFYLKEELENRRRIMDAREDYARQRLENFSLPDDFKQDIRSFARVVCDDRITDNLFISHNLENVEDLRALCNKEVKCAE